MKSTSEKVLKVEEKYVTKVNNSKNYKGIWEIKL
jgi:hypothetical protein